MFLDFETLGKLFIAIIYLLHIEFGNMAWTPTLEMDRKLIEGALRRAAKIIPGLKNLSYEQRQWKFLTWSTEESVEV